MTATDSHVYMGQPVKTINDWLDRALYPTWFHKQ